MKLYIKIILPATLAILVISTLYFLNAPKNRSELSQSYTSSYQHETFGSKITCPAKKAIWSQNSFEIGGMEKADENIIVHVLKWNIDKGTSRPASTGLAVDVSGTPKKPLAQDSYCNLEIPKVRNDFRQGDLSNGNIYEKTGIEIAFENQSLWGSRVIARAVVGINAYVKDSADTVYNLDEAMGDFAKRFLLVTDHDGNLLITSKPLTTATDAVDSSYLSKTKYNFFLVQVDGLSTPIYSHNSIDFKSSDNGKTWMPFMKGEGIAKPNTDYSPYNEGYPGE